MLEVGGSVLHPVSYQFARHHGVPVGGAYVAQVCCLPGPNYHHRHVLPRGAMPSPQTGYMLSRADLPAHSVIVSIDSRPTPTIVRGPVVAGLRVLGSDVL